MADPKRRRGSFADEAARMTRRQLDAAREEVARLTAANRDLARRVSDLEDAVAKGERERDEARAQFFKAAAEVGNARNERTEMHRRCQNAEAQLATERAARERAEAQAGAMREALTAAHDAYGHACDDECAADSDGDDCETLRSLWRLAQERAEAALATNAGASLVAIAEAARTIVVDDDRSHEALQALRDAVAAWQRGGGR